MKKVKAFTIIELTVSLLISSIVIGITYYAFLFFTKQYHSYQRKSDTFSEYRLFKKAFQHDLENANFVTDSVPNTILMRGGGHEIVYAWDSNNIKRQKGEITDSFRLKKNKVAVNYINDTLPLAKQIIVRFAFNKTFFETMFTKQYSAGELMEAEKKNNE